MTIVVRFKPIDAAGRIVSEFESSGKLISVHVNSMDDHMPTSGYTHGVKLFDLATEKVDLLECAVYSTCVTVIS